MSNVDDVQREHDRMKPLGAEFTMPPTKVTGSTIAMQAVALNSSGKSKPSKKAKS